MYGSLPAMSRVGLRNSLFVLKWSVGTAVDRMTDDTFFMSRIPRYLLLLHARHTLAMSS